MTNNRMAWHENTSWQNLLVITSKHDKNMMWLDFLTAQSQTKKLEIIPNVDNLVKCVTHMGLGNLIFVTLQVRHLLQWSLNYQVYFPLISICSVISLSSQIPAFLLVHLQDMV